MSPQGWAAVIAGVGLVMSLVGAAIMVSYRVGKVEAELRAMMNTTQVAVTAAISANTERLARIEGMFELRLRTPPQASD